MFAWIKKLFARKPKVTPIMRRVPIYRTYRGDLVTPAVKVHPYDWSRHVPVSSSNDDSVVPGLLAAETILGTYSGGGGTPTSDPEPYNGGGGTFGGAGASDSWSDDSGSSGGD